MMGKWGGSIEMFRPPLYFILVIQLIILDSTVLVKSDMCLSLDLTDVDRSGVQEYIVIQL